ncbi:MAG: PadR family transcriptional regulator [Planctomycetota bacterium]
MKESEAANKKFQKELNAGTVSLILLSILAQADEPMYGYQIAKQVQARAKDIPMIKQGALYPVLRSLEKSGLLASTIEPSVAGPPRRYYSITKTGRNTRSTWVETWNRAKKFVDSIIKGNDYE